MNAARLAKSNRLQRVAKLLHDRQWHSTRDIIREAQVCAVNSIMAELKRNNFQYECRRSGDVWYYRQA